jgi:hypothetical protein
MGDKKPFLTTDYSNLNATEEVLRKQANCKHLVYDILDKNTVEGYRYDIKRDIRIVEFMCVDCGMVFSKETKAKK